MTGSRRERIDPCQFQRPWKGQIFPADLNITLVSFDLELPNLAWAVEAGFHGFSHAPIPIERGRSVTNLGPLLRPCMGWPRSTKFGTVITHEKRVSGNQPRPSSRAQVHSVRQIFGTSYYMRARNLKTGTVIHLHGDQTRCEENFLQDQSRPLP